MAGKSRGQPSKLIPEVRDQLMQLISMGVSVEDACGHAGISKQTFYNWRAASERLRDQADSLWLQGVGMPVTAEQVISLTFLDALTRAYAEARVVAIATLRSAMLGMQQTEMVTETFSETRLRKNGKGEEIPYEYRRMTTRQIAREVSPDWRAALEYLRRRVPEEWGDRIKVDWRVEAVALIKSGEIDYDDAVGELGEDDAAELFIRAGVPVPR